MNLDDADAIICPLADAPIMVRGSSLNRRCRGCKRRVMMSPSGERRIQRFPKIKVLCVECLLAEADSDVVEAYADLNELKADLGNIVRNTWRERN
jgi:hypothetical protein